ncbi:PREDICTED: polypeptide N-acetylgalactosaminyltransferase 15 [Elephantulus edwardii]|uniref:polypeptide N-acetylgalactosaminyltransferase 15 n=1 Tax=Elephantulus edwardii TaxID=28737 RepID=UPI0003F07EA8|nr:PREDICTED: polypeptide N-acetylgalactosaminyltransferase 15 [Elephantulus edwardii]
MMLRRRYGPGPLRAQFLLLLVVLACVLLLVAVLPPAPQDLQEAATARTCGHSPEAGYRLDFGESQEWLLEDEDEAQEYGALEGLPPLISLREDQLLVAVASPRAKRDQSQSRLGGSYQLIKQPAKGLGEQPPERNWGAEEEDEDVSEEDEFTTLSLDPRDLQEAPSAPIPTRRALPEARHPLCLQQHPAASLPTASVVLDIHGEAWAAVLRTVHSILATAPRAVLKEVVLVENLSQRGQVRSALSGHVARLEGVKLLRSNRKLDAIQRRMLGATRATGDVLVFMDSHCECHPGWLEPLLSRIAGDRRRVVSPVIDVIDWKTLRYHPSEDLQRGVLDWRLDVHWEPLPGRERSALQSPISPIRSPVVPGGVVAVDRRHFQNTGGFDPHLSQQDGGDLELSLKAWLCGGSVEILPCSRVGLLYQNQDPRPPLDQEATLRDKVRIAETWLGSFKETFYKHVPEALSLNQAERPDCAERLQLQRSLGCRMFPWFLASVYPELYPSEHRPRFSGKLHNAALGLCADCQAEGDVQGCPVTLVPCSDSRKQQHLHHISRKQIHFGSPQHLCFDVSGELVTLQNCTEGEVGRQHWDVQENGMIVHILSGRCMEAVVQENNRHLYLHQCDGKASQLWRYDQVSAVGER